MTVSRQARPHRRIATLALSLSLVCVAFVTAPARAAEPHFAFAVISGVMKSVADEPAAQRLIDAIGLDQRLSFVVYDGNVKGPREQCSDTLYDRRQQLLAPIVKRV